jgi:hypothetical protein
MSSLNNPLFEIPVNGKLILRDSEFEGFSRNSHSLIMMYGGYVLVDGCLFSNVSLMDGNGSVVNANIETDDELKILSVLFYSLFFFF